MVSGAALLALMYCAVFSRFHSGYLAQPVPALGASMLAAYASPARFADALAERRRAARGPAPRVPAALDAGVDADVTRVDGETLIFGDGRSLENGSVIFDAATNQILYAGPSAGVPQGLAANTTFAVRAVMPGLWDCHTHFMGVLGEGGKFEDHGFLSADFPTNYVLFHSALLELEEALMMGITSVREMGGMFGQALHLLEQSGSIMSPHFHFAGRMISMTGGHGDDQLLPESEFERMDRQRLSAGTTCDGPAECTKRVRENLRMQADVIKIVTSGGVLSEFDQPTDAQLSLAEIRAMTDEAARAGRAVAAHAHGETGIQSAIDGGVTSIEHGTYMTLAQAKEIKKKGYMIYTPTLTVHQVLFNHSVKPPNLDDNQWRKGRAVLKRNTEAAEQAIREGVPIVAGTDCPQGCALVGKEINYLRMFGMTPLEAIRAATGNAPRCLGGMAPKSGVLAKGYESDVIALDANPLDNLEVLTDGERITHVWKAGRLLKSAGRLAPPGAARKPLPVEVAKVTV